MLTEKYKDFINYTVNKLIESYEKTTKKKYNPNDIESIKDIIAFLNGSVVYVRGLSDKYGIDKILVTKENKDFIIAIDTGIEEESELNTKKSLFSMLWLYINAQLDNDGEIPNNSVIYPDEISHLYYELMSFIEEGKSKSLIKERKDK